MEDWGYVTDTHATNKYGEAQKDLRYETAIYRAERQMGGLWENKAVYTTAPVAGSWAGAVMSWAGAVMIWAGV